MVQDVNSQGRLNSSTGLNGHDSSFKNTTEELLSLLFMNFSMKIWLSCITRIKFDAHPWYKSAKHVK